MSEYLEYDFTITPEKLADLVEKGMQIQVVINGMYYTVKTEKEETK